MAAKGASLVDRVVVSTDDGEIAQAARDAGAEIVMRPAEFSTDTASSESVLLHALEYLEAADGYRPEALCLVQATSPLMLPEDLDGAIRLVTNDGADTALVVTRHGRFIWRQDETGDAVGINHDKSRRLRRQEREPEFMETGSIYVMKTEGFLQHRHRFFGRTAVYEIEEIRSLEIDTEADLCLAEILSRYLLEHSHE